MIAFPIGCRVRNIQTNEIATVVAKHKTVQSGKTIACKYDDDSIIWYTPVEKLIKEES